MNVVLWVIAVVIGAAFVGAGVIKVTQPKDKLYEQGLTWVEDFSANTVKLIGGVEILGALGLILPAGLGIATVLTPLAALGLAITMLLAVVVHVRRHEVPGALPALVLGVLAAVVAWGRFGPYPF